MADVAGFCYAGRPQICGRAIVRVSRNQIAKIEPKINTQPTSAQLETKYDNRFNHRAYYFDSIAT